jgi:hypothetical protein
MTKQETRTTGECYKSLMTKNSVWTKGHSTARNTSVSPQEMLNSSKTTSLYYSKGNSGSNPKNTNPDGSSKVSRNNPMDETQSNITHLLNPNDVTYHRMPPGPIWKKMEYKRVSTGLKKPRIFERGHNKKICFLYPQMTIGGVHRETSQTKSRVCTSGEGFMLSATNISRSNKGQSNL